MESKDMIYMIKQFFANWMKNMVHRKNCKVNRHMISRYGPDWRNTIKKL